LERLILIIKLSTTYTPNSKWYVDYDSFIKAADISDQNQLISNFNNFSNEIQSLNSRLPFSVDQRLNAFYALDDNHIFSFESSHLYKRQRPNYDLQATQQPFAGTLPLLGDTPFHLLQDKEVFTNNLDAELNYYRILNATNHISFKTGLSVNNQRLRSTLIENLTNGTTNVLVPDMFGNRANFDFLDLYFGISYRVKLGKLVLNPSLNFHVYNTENNQTDETTELNKTLLLPSLGVKYDINSSQSIQFNYGIEAEFSDIQNLVSGIQLQGYNRLFAGNPTLQNAWYHNATLNYFNFSMFSYTTINGGLSYQKKYNTIGPTINFLGLDRITEAVNIDAPNEILTFFGNYERKFVKWQVNLSSKSGDWI